MRRTQADQHAAAFWERVSIAKVLAETIRKTPGFKVSRRYDVVTITGAPQATEHKNKPRKATRARQSR